VSVHKKWKKVTVPQIRARKGGEPIVCLTSYTSLTAVLLDEHVDLMLVGDSLGMVLYGMDSTLGVTLDMMIAHGKARFRHRHHLAELLRRGVTLRPDVQRFQRRKALLRDQQHRG